MATTYNNLAQAQAAYDTLLKQKQRVQRNDYINQQQAVMGVNNYLKQQGYNGGAAESILLRARGNRSDLSSYDAELANLAAIIKGLRSSGSGAYSSSQANSAATKLKLPFASSSPVSGLAANRGILSNRNSLK